MFSSNLQDMKDNFSSGSDKYARYRPGYPDAFFNHLKPRIKEPENACDCATGNGQIAGKLAAQFSRVFATDISQQQIENAVKASNIFYSVQPAEQTTFPPDFFNLVTVGQAIHWLDFEKFFMEVERTCRKNAVLVLIGYGRLITEPGLTAVVDHFYSNIVGSYWNAERKYIDERYTTIPFPFEEIAFPEFENVYDWTLEQLTGYLKTWSAVKHYIKANNADPVDLIYPALKENWGSNATQQISFPLIIKAGRVNPLN